MIEGDPTFEDRYDAIVHEINKRKTRWTLASMSFDDVRQIVLMRVHVKFAEFDPAKTIGGRPVEFSHWVNKVISNAIINITRDNHSIYSRPCILGCKFNTGGDTCSKTSTGLQCNECPIYRSWEKRKIDHFNVKQTLPLENHMREADSQPNESVFFDFEEKKKMIEKHMKIRLNKHEWRLYKLLYIQGKTEKEVGKIMGYKGPKSKMYAGYLTILKAKKRFVLLAKEIIAEEDLA